MRSFEVCATTMTTVQNDFLYGAILTILHKVVL